MTPERAQAYGRVMKMLADLSASKFHAAEEDAIREAADSLLFCDDLGADSAAVASLTSVAGLCERMVTGDRLMPQTAERLLAALEGCGPYAVPDSLPLPEPVV